MKTTLQNNSLLKKVKKVDRKTLEVQSIQQCKEILILYGQAGQQNIADAKQFKQEWLEQFSKAKIDILLVDMTQKKKDTNLFADYTMLFKNDFNWKFEPTAGNIQIFNKEYDLVVDLTKDGATASAALLVKLNYKCCVGWGDLQYSELYDIVISDKNLTLREFKNNIEKYLS